MSIEDCQVLIVGAGPVGLLLALLLHGQNIKVKIIERQKALYPLPRAVAFDHESRRLFGSVGLTEQLEPILENITGKGGEDGTNYVWRDADLKMVVDLFMEAPSRSGFPLAMGFNQPQLEGLLEQEVMQRGIPLIRGYSVSVIEDLEDRVRVQAHAVSAKKGTTLEERDIDGVRGAEPDLVLEASYVVGCDGANSTVRRLKEFTSKDLNFQSDWLVLDILLRDGYIPPRVQKAGACQVCDPVRPTTCVFAGYGRKRFEFMRLEGESKEHLLDEETAWELLASWGFKKDNCDLERRVIYTFGARWAEQFSKDRVVLAGDALHLMPPFLGQGLNSGFRDAAALAWRLPLMLSGVANPEPLLRSYQEERLEHVRNITLHCIKLGEVVCQTDPEMAKVIHAELRRNPPPNVHEPCLGRPGIMTAQPEAGKLSLQRPLRCDDSWALFDEVHGCGWQLLNLGPVSTEHLLSGDARAFFCGDLGGQCISVTSEEDVSGGYSQWFADSMGLDQVVLIRPDFYVFGHASASDVNVLVQQLKTKMVS